MSKQWTHGQLGQLFETVTGSTPSKSKKQYYGDDVPLVKPPELQNRPMDSAEDSLSHEGAKVARVLPPKSILVSCIGNLGKIGMNTIPVAFNQQINAIKPDYDKAIPEFVFYLTLSPSFAGQLHALASGTTVPIVNKSKFNSIQIALPPLPEQKRIVAILDEAFAGIDAAVANTEKNLANGRELFESYLNGVFTRKGEGWVEKTLGTIGATQTGSTPKAIEVGAYGSFIPFVKPADFNKDGTLNYESTGLSAKGLESAREVEANSVLMVCIGATIGKCGYCVRNVTTNQQINVLTPCDGVSYRFIYYQMLTTDFQRRVLLNSSQATLPIINKSKWCNLMVTLPPSIKDQNRFADKFDALLEETQHLETIYQKKLAALAELKQSILQKAFAGELTTLPEKTLEEAVA